MIQTITPSEETDRLNVLDSYRILDTPPEQQYDDITDIASSICNTPIALITLIDKDRQWFKSKKGIEISETPREHAFCARTITQPQCILEVPDATKDKRFSKNPFTLNDPYVIFYAGAPLNTPSGHCLGTLCVIDSKPGRLDERQKEALRVLASQTVQLLEARKVIFQISNKNDQLTLLHRQLNSISQNFIYELKDHAKDINSLLTWFNKGYSKELSEDLTNWIDLLNHNNIRIRSTIELMLSYHSLSVQKLVYQEFNVEQMITRLIQKSEHFDRLEISLLGTNKLMYHSEKTIASVFECLLLKTVLKSRLNPSCWITYLADDKFHYFFFEESHIDERETRAVPEDSLQSLYPITLDQSWSAELNIIKLILGRIQGNLISANEDLDKSKKLEIQIPRI